MQKLLRPQDKWRDIVFGSVAILVIIVDQVTKALIRANLAPGQVFVDIGFFRIIHLTNTGAAFGIFQGRSLAFIITAAVGVLAIIILVLVSRGRWSFFDSMWVRVGMGLVLGGTIGNNLIDRISQGFVTDFLDFKIWPAFNVSDMSVTVGVIIVIYRLIFYSSLTKSKK
jgi:signal peptidase II